MRARWVVLLVLATNLFTLALVFGVRAYDEHYDFDAAEWIAEKPGDCTESHRRQMVEDLDARILRIGLTTESVQAILGRPDFKIANEWYYETGIVISDCETLALSFDGPRGQLIEWSHPTLRD